MQWHSLLAHLAKWLSSASRKLRFLARKLEAPASAEMRSWSWNAEVVMSEEQAMITEGVPGNLCTSYRRTALGIAATARLR